jgi:hypothetical protein
MNAVAIGYTLSSERMYATSFHEFHSFCEQLLGRDIWTHEFADKGLWTELRNEFEKQRRRQLSGV